MNETNVVFQADDAFLYGTLRTPDGVGPYPTALILAGSGPLDRDGDHKRLPLSVSKDIAVLLSDVGWASLRFDKRGVGESGGNYMSTGFYDELADAIAALRWLQVQPTTASTIVVGHSLGAVYAAEMSATQPDLAGAVMLSYTVKTGEQTLVWQAAALAETIPRFAKALLAIFRTSVGAQQAKALEKLKNTESDVARVKLQKVNAKWMREFIAYDPAPTLALTKTPLLAITGSKDIQVDPGDLAIVATVVGDRVRTHVVPDVDHILRHEEAAVSNPRKYKEQIRRPIDERVTSALTSWLDTLATDDVGDPVENQIDER